MLAGPLRCAGAGVLAAVVFAWPAQAADYNVTNGNDAGPGSLRAALEAANQVDDFDRVVFTAAHAVQSSSALTAAGPLAIDGAAGKISGGDLLIVEPYVTVSRLGVVPPHRISTASPAAPSGLRVYRGSDSHVRIAGTAGAPGLLELFTGAGESFLERYAGGVAPGAFSQPLAAEPPAGAQLTLTLTTSEGTSPFASPVAVPDDLVSPRVTEARTADADGDGRADLVRVETSKRLDDGSGFAGLVLEGAPFTGVRSGAGRDDDELEGVLAAPQPGDVRPLVRVAANTTLADSRGNQVLVMAEGVRAVDSVAPEGLSAVGISRLKVRVRFTEPVTSASAQAEDFSLSMGGEARTVTAVDLGADGRTAELTADRPWPHGTAGLLRIKGPLTDRAGNASRGTRPAFRVWASPGDIVAPSLRGVRLAQRVICIKVVSANCARSGGRIAFTVDEPVTIVLEARRRGSDAPSTLKVARSEGPGTVSFKEKIEGRRLRPGTYRLTMTAVDAAGNESRPRVLTLRVRR